MASVVVVVMVVVVVAAEWEASHVPVVELDTVARFSVTSSVTL